MPVFREKQKIAAKVVAVENIDVSGKAMRDI